MRTRHLACPVCGQPMYLFENPVRWVCINVKVHDKAMNDLWRKDGSQPA